MSFFERLKTEASAEWRAYIEHLSGENARAAEQCGAPSPG